MSFAEQCVTTIEKSRSPGGQQVGCDHGIIVVKHMLTGVEIRVPPSTQRSQHRRRQAALEALEYVVSSL